MREGTFKIGVVAPGSPIDPALAGKVVDLAAALYPGHSPDLRFHPQCFLTSGHFAGDDDSRRQAFLEVANDEGYDALWFARGGYGACRLAERLLPALTDAARRKTYLGYSDAGALLGGLYKEGFALWRTDRCPPTSTGRAARWRWRGHSRLRRWRAKLALEPTVSPRRQRPPST